MGNVFKKNGCFAALPPGEAVMGEKGQFVIKTNKLESKALEFILADEWLEKSD